MKTITFPLDLGYRGVVITSHGAILPCVVYSHIYATPTGIEYAIKTDPGTNLEARAVTSGRNIFRTFNLADKAKKERSTINDFL